MVRSGMAASPINPNRTDFTLKRPLTTAEERFVQNIVKGMGPTEAYTDAFPHKKDQSAHVRGNAAYNLLHSEPCATRFDQLLKEAHTSAVLSREEKLLILSSLVRDPESSDKTRLSALDLLNKMEGDYTKQIKMDINAPVSETALAVAEILECEDVELIEDERTTGKKPEELPG